LADQALLEMRETFETVNGSGLALLFSLRHDFPTEWSAFANGAPGSDFTVRLRKDYFPYFVQRETLAVDRLELYAAAPGADKLKKRMVAVPGSVSDDLNAPAGHFDLLLPPDAAVLTPGGGQVFLIIHYSF
jgi:hypothetical protein